MMFILRFSSKIVRVVYYVGKCQDLIIDYQTTKSTVTSCLLTCKNKGKGKEETGMKIHLYNMSSFDC